MGPPTFPSCNFYRRTYVVFEGTLAYRSNINLEYAGYQNQ